MNPVFVILLMALILFGGGCSSGTPTNKYPLNKQNLLTTKQDTSDHKYNLILRSLCKNYVVNIDAYNRKSLLTFYHKSNADFLKDSIEYYQAVNDFYLSDSSIVEYLLIQFERDTTRCFWIYSIHPHSSNIKNWEFEFSKQQGALVLIYDYLIWNGSKKKVVTTSPSQIEKIINSIGLVRIKEWLEKNKELPLEELRKNFAVNFGV